MDFTLVPHKSTRSLEQNARYWSLLTEISEQLKPDGHEYSPETWHQYLRAKFIGKDTVVVDGDVLFVPKTTTKLKVAEFSDLMTQVEAWGTEHGVRFTEWRVQA